MEARSFSSLLKGYLHGMALGPTPREVLRLSSAPTATSEDFAHALRKNPAYSAFIQRIDFIQKRRAEWQAEVKDSVVDVESIFLERALRIIGKDATRNLVLCFALARKLDEKLPRDPGDRLHVSPPEMLKYALSAESYCQSRSLAHSDQAFAAGLHFDFLIAFLKSKKALTKPVESYIPIVWSEALRSARLAYAMASQLKDFEEEKYAFASALVLGCGKILMAMQYSASSKTAPSWSDLIANCEEYRDFRFNAFVFEEPRKFASTHSELAALVVSFMGTLASAEPAIRYATSPYYLKESDNPGMHRLAQILHLATTLSSPVVPQIGLLQQRWMKELGIDQAKFQDQQSKIFAEATKR